MADRPTAGGAGGGSMRYEDYEAEIILRECIPGYGRSVLMITTAKSRDKAIEAARREFTALTGLPSSLIESVKVALVTRRKEG